MYNKTTMKFIRSGVPIAVILIVILACGSERNVRKGDRYLALGEYFDAADQFKRAYSKTPVKQRAERGMIALKLAGCYARINMAPKAVAAYRNAVRFGNISAEDRLLFARQLLKNGLYREAAEVFGNVLDSLSDNELARNGLLSAGQSPIWRKAGSR